MEKPRRTILKRKLRGHTSGPAISEGIAQKRVRFYSPAYKKEYDPEDSDDQGVLDDTEDSLTIDESSASVDEVYANVETPQESNLLLPNGIKNEGRTANKNHIEETEAAPNLTDGGNAYATETTEVYYGCGESGIGNSSDESNQSYLPPCNDGHHGSTAEVQDAESSSTTESCNGNDGDHETIIMAGPDTPLPPRRIYSLKPMHFSKEPLDLRCEWDNCTYATRILNVFMEHVVSHTPSVEISQDELSQVQVLLVCNWKTCPFKTPRSQDLERHIYLHGYHTKLKCIGANTAKRSDLNSCNSDPRNGNILPDLSDRLICAWADCSEKFINIQQYYDHIRYHCEDNEKGRHVKGGIPCLWAGCNSSYSNIARLRDHVRSHTQEKMLSCPICGALFSNRTRFFDHCRRQTLLDKQNYACELCMKMFSTARLLRDHIRSHVNIYKCQQCEMSCSSTTALNSHVKYRHSDEKPFQCPTCSYAAKTQSDLGRHIKLHEQAIRKCEVPGCDYQAKSAIAIEHHIGKVHEKSKQAKYLCHICDKKFLRGYYLTKHLINIHSLQWPSGHSRFRYKLGEDGLFRLCTLRYDRTYTESEISEAEDEAQEEILDPLSIKDLSVGKEANNADQEVIAPNRTRREFTFTEQILEYTQPVPQNVTYVLYPTSDMNVKL